APARHDLGAQAQRAAELLGCGHRLLGGLAVDVEDAGKGEDKVGTLLQRHVSFSQSASSKAATSLASRGRNPASQVEPPTCTMLNALPCSMFRSPRRALPFFSDRRCD